MEIYEKFEGEEDLGFSSSLIRQEEFTQNPFETRAIFTLADFLKSLGPNEYYDIAQKLYNEWDSSTSSTGPLNDVAIKLRRFVRIADKHALIR